MNGPQDVGGMMGFGPVVPEPEAVRFHADWEKRVLAVTLAASAAGVWTIDAMRFSRESLPPAEYYGSSYYQIWLKALTNRLIAEGLVTPEEIATGTPMEPAKPVPRVLRADRVGPALAAGTRYAREPDAAARFAVGDAVRARVINPPTHTRLPRYVRGKVGVVERVQGVFVLPDTNAHDLGETPQWLFTVRFSGTELWGPQADPTLDVSVDAWESYLDPVD
ncbi:nitrile hydratase subunit beta [Methylobacterium sp. sgz302541]|uniref:nitrile hydratase subunit beta n=1 Tax=unclassified Methylobacterium TaxID=2615210 RepID=UPI003D328EA6